MSERPKNVILLCTDEFRGDMLAASGRNSDIKTRHVDGLARLCSGTVESQETPSDRDDPRLDGAGAYPAMG